MASGHIVGHCQPHLTALAAAALLTLGACATPPTPRAPASLYEDLGGADGIAALVDQFLWQLADDPRVNQRFADTHLARFRDKLNEQFCQLSGGPCTYTGDSMAQVHAGHGIDHAQFNAVVDDLIAAMEARAIATGVQNRLLAVLAPLHADIIER